MRPAAKLWWPIVGQPTKARGKEMKPARLATRKRTRSSSCSFSHLTSRNLAAAVATTVDASTHRNPILSPQSQSHPIISSRRSPRSCSWAWPTPCAATAPAPPWRRPTAQQSSGRHRLRSQRAAPASPYGLRQMKATDRGDLFDRPSFVVVVEDGELDSDWEPFFDELEPAVR